MTRWTYDPVTGKCTAKRYPDGSRIGYAYADNVRRTRTTWARGVRRETAYDHRHRRVEKRVERFDGDDWQTVETHHFVYDGCNIVLELIALADGTARSVEYFWGNDLSGTEQGAGGVGGLLAVSADGLFYFPFYDHNGNVVGYVSESGADAAQYVYDPYGNVIEQQGDLVDAFAFRFSTKYYDRETGMVGYQRRFYRPDLGRWLNRDPIEEDGGENLYAFCQNNSIVYFDANGESFDDVSNFMAGVADSLTFGLTGAVRSGINFAVHGDWEDPADVQSGSYTAGEYTEIAVEIVVSLGGTALRHVAKVASRGAVEKGARKSFRRAYGLTESGGFIHHINPIKGHPGGARARYPLPFEWAARGHWNMTWVATHEEHMAAHETMKMFDKIDKWRTYTIGVRQGANMLMHKLNGSSDTKCWDSIDIQLKIEHTMGTINTVPNSVSISYEELGRSE